MVKFIEDEDCHFVSGLKCKWPIAKEALLANMGEGTSDDVHSLRPFEYTGTCTNCLLSMILEALHKESNIKDATL